jgi:hypothetical protein
MVESRKFRLSIIDYLNAAPLNHGFKHGLGYGGPRSANPAGVSGRTRSVRSRAANCSSKPVR